MSVSAGTSSPSADKRGVSDMQEFVTAQARTFLKPERYARCLVQEQGTYVEVGVEKDALASIFEDAIWPYCTRLNICRGRWPGFAIGEQVGGTRLGLVPMPGGRVI